MPGFGAGVLQLLLPPLSAGSGKERRRRKQLLAPKFGPKRRRHFFFFGGGGLQLNVSGLVFRICLCHEVLGTFGDHSEVWDVDLGDRIEHIVGSRLEDDIHMRTPSPVIVALHHVAASLRLGLCLSVPDRLRRVSVAFPASETQLPAT